MAYDEQLADRVRAVLATWRGVSEKRMFGGLTFLIDGHTCCGIVGDELMVCVGPLAYVTALAKRRARRWTSQVDRSGATYTSREKVSGQIKQCDRGSSGE